MQSGFSLLGKEIVDVASSGLRFISLWAWVMHRHVLFKRFFCTVMLILGLLAGCDRAPEKKEIAERTPVTFLHYFTGSLSGGIHDMAQSFSGQSARHDLKAISLDHEAFKTSIQDSIKSGSPPDLYSYWAGARTASIVDDLESIDDLWQRERLDEKFSPAVIRAASEYRGKKYFVPITQHFVAFFYNRKVFDAHGLRPPATWDEFMALCAARKAKGVTPIALGARDKWPAQFWFDYLLLRTTPYEFREKLLSGKAKFDSPEVAQVFSRWKTLIDKGYINAKPHPNELAWDTGANEMVFRGEAAMTLMGSWNIGYFTNTEHRWEPERDFDFFPFPVINPDISMVAMGPIDGLILPKRAANHAGAKDVLAYFAGAEAQRKFSQGSGALAPNTQVPQDSYNNMQRRIQQEVGRSPQFAFAFDLAAPPQLAELGLNAFSEFLAFPAAYSQIAKKMTVDTEKALSGPTAKK